MSAPPTNPGQVDTYGFRVHRGAQRHPACPCVVPCQATFICPSKLHVGAKAMPWCRGGHPGDECDQCFSRMHAESRGMGACAACGCPAQGNHSVERDGMFTGNEVEICDACGAEETPTLDEIVAAIAKRNAA